MPCGWLVRRQGLVTKLDPRSGAPGDDDRRRQRRPPPSPSAAVVSGWPITTMGRSSRCGSTRPPHCGRCHDPGSAAARSPSSPDSARSGWRTPVRGRGADRSLPPPATVRRRISTGRRRRRSRSTAVCGDVWAGATASRALTHRGGTLRYEIAPEAGVSTCTCVYRRRTTGSAGRCCRSPMTGAGPPTVACRGVGGSTLIADLAEAGSAAARRRPHIHIPVAPVAGVSPTARRCWPATSARARFGSGWSASRGRPTSTMGSPGTERCTPRRCYLLVGGIETDDTARTIAIHLRRPDTEFLDKFALPTASIPPRVHAAAVGPMIVPVRIVIQRGCARGLKLRLNPQRVFLRSWSSVACPGFSRRGHGRHLPRRSGFSAVPRRPLGAVMFWRLVRRPGGASRHPGAVALRGTRAASTRDRFSQLPLPQRARAAVRRPARTGAGAQFRRPSPPRGSSSVGVRPLVVLKAPFVRAARLRCPPRRRRLDGAGPRPGPAGWSRPPGPCTARVLGLGPPRLLAPIVPLRRRGASPAGLPGRGCESCRCTPTTTTSTTHVTTPEVMFFNWVDDFPTASSFFASLRFSDKSCASVLSPAGARGQPEPVAVLRSHAGRRRHPPPSTPADGGNANAALGRTGSQAARGGAGGPTLQPGATRRWSPTGLATRSCTG